MGIGGDQSGDDVLREIRERFPGFREAVMADAVLTAQFRGERHEFASRVDATLQILRLCAQSDAFAAQLMYRLKASLQRRGVPILPRLAHRLAMVLAQLSIGDPVVMHPGIYIIHGGVVIDGLVEIHSGTAIAPWVTIGLRSGNFRGATVERNVHLGTGSKVIGPVTVGEGAQVGANAVVVDDVPAWATVVGAPARSVAGQE
jgi:serine O-acetyltransferase